MAGRNADSQGPSWPSESESAFEQVSQGVPSAAMARTLVCPLIFFQVMLSLAGLSRRASLSIGIPIALACILSCV